MTEAISEGSLQIINGMSIWWDRSAPNDDDDDDDDVVDDVDDDEDNDDDDLGTWKARESDNMGN